MCGIAGIVSLGDGVPPPEIDDLGRMAGALRHRGPDEFGIYRDRRAGLAHARLSIIDLSTGQQPLANESGTLWTVFNGEIFNYIELRAELEVRGHRFATQSDTEVIVHAYEEWGDGAFRRFNGQWAIALWDSERSRLVLARDPFGVRPLYVTQHRGRLYFASEVKAIFAADRSISRQLDPAGLDQLFTFWSPIAPRTVFEGVDEVPPGTVTTYADGRVQQSRSYDPNYPSIGAGFTGSLDEAVEEVRAALENATALRMLRADVPVGSYLSGGLDSSLIAAMGLRAKGSKFSTFSVRFEDSEYDETTHQRHMAAHLGTEHHEVLVTRGDIAQVFPEVIRHTERPVLRTAPAPLYILSQLVHQSSIKVVLTGEGADEMFAGYDLFREGKVRRFWSRNPESSWRPALLERLYPYLQRSPVSQRAIMRQFFGQRLTESDRPGFAHDPRWRSTGAIKRLFTEPMRARLNGTDTIASFLDSLPRGFERWTPLAQDQYIEVNTLLSGYLLSSQGDRMLMAHSVEGRFPFLDRNVAALAESLPPAYKLKVLDEKHVLKKAARSIVPSSILERAKQPYRAPDALSFAGEEAREWIADVASPAALEAAGIFNPAAATRLLEKCRAQSPERQFSNIDNMTTVAILSTQLVHHHFVRNRPEATPPPRIRTVVDHMTTAPGNL
jgi:asparagine synthase (glutamine-hydrolysing)